MWSILSEFHWCINILHFHVFSLNYRHSQCRGERGRAAGKKLGQQLRSQHCTWGCSRASSHSTRAEPSGKLSCCSKHLHASPLGCCWTCKSLSSPHWGNYNAHRWSPRILSHSSSNSYFTREFEDQWTQNRSKVIYIVSSLLKKSKVLASDSDPQELNFDYVLTLTEKYSFSIGREKTLWSGGRAANHQYNWRLTGRVLVHLETVGLSSANHSERKHIHQRAY